MWGGWVFDLSHIIIKIDFDHQDLVETGRNWPSLPGNDIIPQIFGANKLTPSLPVTTMIPSYKPTNMELLPP